MIGVEILVESPAVVQYGEELEHFDHGTRLLGQAKAVLEHPGPVGDAVEAVPGESVILEDRVQDEGQVQWHVVLSFGFADRGAGARRGFSVVPVVGNSQRRGRRRFGLLGFEHFLQARWDASAF